MGIRTFIIKLTNAIFNPITTKFCLIIDSKVFDILYHFHFWCKVHLFLLPRLWLLVCWHVLHPLDLLHQSQIWRCVQILLWEKWLATVYYRTKLILRYVLTNVWDRWLRLLRNPKWLMDLWIHQVEGFLETFVLSILINKLLHSKVLESLRSTLIMISFLRNWLCKILKMTFIIFFLLKRNFWFLCTCFFLLPIHFFVFFIDLGFKGGLLTKAIMWTKAYILIWIIKCWNAIMKTVIKFVLSSLIVVIYLFIELHSLSYVRIIRYAHWFEHLSHHQRGHFCARHNYFLFKINYIDKIIFKNLFLMDEKI